MPIIEIHTTIDAPTERCFLLSLSVDLHRKSVAQTREAAIAGVTSGLMKAGDTVTWKARHFGLSLQMTSRIAAYEKPAYFVSEMVKGPFQKLYHQHHFKELDGKTRMTDLFELQAPMGFLGKLAEKLFLVAYMKRFLLLRNACIKATAESTDWKKYL